MQHFLPELTLQEVESFKNHLSAHTAPMGTVLVELGSDNRDLYFLETGSCEVYQKFTIGSKLFALRVATLTPPIMLGEANLLLGTKRNATIIVSSEMVYYRLGYQDFCALKEDHKDIAIKLLECIGRLTTQRYLDMQKKLVDRFLAQMPQPTEGIKYLSRFMGNVMPCTPELARKIFNIEQPDIRT
jgi:CRP-like cAMP-binding protein